MEIPKITKDSEGRMHCNLRSIPLEKTKVRFPALFQKHVFPRRRTCFQVLTRVVGRSQNPSKTKSVLSRAIFARASVCLLSSFGGILWCRCEKHLLCLIAPLGAGRSCVQTCSLFATVGPNAERTVHKIGKKTCSYQREWHRYGARARANRYL